MNVLDLFSGIGGFSLGLERAGMRTVAFCEIDPYCKRVLAKHWPNVPCYDDVRTIPRIGNIDVICGGFPCQPFSHAGKQLGESDDRHLWPAMLEVIERERPAWVIGENVVGIVNMALDAILADLEKINYATRVFDIPAGAVGAPHIRRRIWIVARDRDRESTCALDDEAQGVQGIFPDAHGDGCQPDNRRESVPDENRNRATQATGRTIKQSRSIGSSDVADAHGKNLEGGGQSGDEEGRKESNGHAGLGGGIGDQWATEPAVGRVAHGIPNRTHRLRALGNAVVPQIPEIIGKAIMNLKQS